ncbi:LANO_0G00496g1_1 [Lachancea nothofagi CBS 11611]|uniref:LANO_0G00496g1_1 n=1 Tax=Lachancea nothofagi CBS 11611 TaxID=1266666 RepID=A0A1G4KED5_9SACH|nr:LANO_0G00496g1_1 [Lachancea nothofagi CBS 11611]
MYPERAKPKSGAENGRKKRNNSLKPATQPHTNDYTQHYVHTNILPQRFVKNSENQVEGYPNLQKLFRLKEKHVARHATTPYGCRINIDEMVPTLNSWIHNDKLIFDVVMIGCLTDNQFIYPLLTSLPIDRLISKPGFLFIWGSAQKINELTKLLQNDTWAKKFRKSEELVFIPVDKSSPFYPGLDNDDQALFEKMQWHCWMCITGTVRRATDGHLIHCNVDTDLTIESDGSQNSAIPAHLYKIAENFSTATRRLHIIPARTGTETPVRVRPGWVIMSPDVILNNFDSVRYQEDINKVGTHLPMKNEIETLRPKSPVQKKPM